MRNLINKLLDTSLREFLIENSGLTEEDMCIVVDKFLDIIDTLNANKEKKKEYCRTEAYQYLRISRSSFDAKVNNGILPKGHNFSEEWTVDKEATCKEEGSKSHHCANCSEKADVTAIPTTDHNYGEWIIDTNATCEVNGEKHRVCNNCKENPPRICFYLYFQHLD